MNIYLSFPYSDNPTRRIAQAKIVAKFIADRSDQPVDVVCPAIEFTVDSLPDDFEYDQWAGLMRHADMHVVILGTKITMGIVKEIGFAAQHNIPTVVLPLSEEVKKAVERVK